MRKAISAVAGQARFPDLRDQGRLIDRLTDLEAEGLTTNAPQRTLETIRAARMKVRIASLSPAPPVIRGH